MDETAFDPDELESLVSQCFQGGEIRRRELRLTPAQIECLCKRYPVTVRPLGADWYDILFKRPVPHFTKGMV